jgi:hypothetical protein
MRKITWIEPDRPEIPSQWCIIINGQNGTAYEDINEYINDLNILLEEQLLDKNESTEEDLAL